MGVAVDMDGDLFLTGETSSPSVDGQVSAGGEDVVLAKYSNDGSKLWTRLIGGTGNEQGRSIAVDGTGNAYVTGLTEFLDMFLAKFDGNGTMVWIQSLGGPAWDMGYDVAVDNAGDVFVVGATDSATFDGQTSAGDTDVFLTKYDPTGTRLWTRMLGGWDDDRGWSVAVDSAGNAFITGSTSSFGFGSEIPLGGGDAFLVKYSGSGARVWTRVIGGPASDRGTDVAIDSAGDVYVTGETYSSFNGQTGAGSSDAFLTRYTSDGSHRWTRLLGGLSRESGEGVAVGGTDDVYVTGETLSGVLDGQSTAGLGDVFLAKFNKSGFKQWTRLIGGPLWEEGAAIEVDPNENVFLVGDTSSDPFFGLSNAGSSDIFLIKFVDEGTP